MAVISVQGWRVVWKKITALNSSNVISSALPNWRKSYRIRSSFFGDASDQELLAEEHIDQVDLFIAVTNDDEANIMSAMLAKRMGAKKVMVLIQRRAYVDLVQGSVIDIAISPQQATISALLSHVRKADIVGVSSLRRGVAEAIEAVAHGDESTSRVVGRVIDEIKLPPGNDYWSGGTWKRRDDCQ